MKKKNQLVPTAFGAIQKVSNVLKLTEKILSENSLTVKNNTFTDSRDGQKYKTVRLKEGKVWMAQNLNFDVGEGCWFYDNDAKNGKKYGRLYTWEAAQRACPEGWRLPTDGEWWEMTNLYGKAWNTLEGQQENDAGDAGDAAYKALIQGGSSSFSALLGGKRYSDGNFYYLDESGYYWSSSEQSSSDVWNYDVRSGRKYLGRNYGNKTMGFSCRCLQD